MSLLVPRRGYTPFRNKLFYMVMGVIGILALLILPFELYRPIDNLRQMSATGTNLLAGMQSFLATDDLARLNRFALAAEQRFGELDDEARRYQQLAFKLLIEEGRVLPEGQVLARLGEWQNEVYSHRRLRHSAREWVDLLATDPGVDALLRHYKRHLQQVRDESIAAGFLLDDIYIMLDSGRREGVFADHILFVIDAMPWWQHGPYPGQRFNTERHPYWRADAFAGREGYAHNPLHDPDNYYLPRFDRDEWGTWFSVWRTREVGGAYNQITIDFEASSVREMMGTVLRMVGLVTLVALLLVMGLALWLSLLVTAPIRALTLGAREVAKGNYEHVVPVYKHDELGELTHAFNNMTEGQRERLNMKQTLEKLLSRELAEQAGREGMMLGGQSSDCTLMFTDFTGFSTLTQQMQAGEAVMLLNLYFDALIPIIKEHGGFPDKYIGDAIVAIFGAPVALGDHAVRALRCAVEMQRRMRAINQERRARGEVIFEMRIGLNSGEVLVGAIGCDMKLEYTAIGETTNLANRMETASPIGHLMVAEGTWQAVRTEQIEALDLYVEQSRVSVKGYPEPVQAYAIYVDGVRIARAEHPSRLGFYTYREVGA